MKNLILLVCVLFLIPEIMAQNVVSNPSFETKDGSNCPYETGFDTGASPQYWSTPSFHGFTPDYFYPCAFAGSAWYPGSNSTGCEYPLNGQSYTGLLAQIVYSNNTVDNAGSEYMSQQLTLMGGQQYYVEFWVSPAEGTTSNPMSSYVSTLGMYFTKTPAPDFSNGANKGLHHLASFVQYRTLFPQQTIITPLTVGQK